MTSFKSRKLNLISNIVLGKMTEVKVYESIIATMHSEQCEHLYFKFSDAYIKYRQVVAEWMVDVAVYFNLHATTTHAAVAYLDRLQPNEKFSRYEWQMLAICCLLISSKYNESEENIPGLRRLEEITQQSIANSTILNYELWALKRMGWKLNARIPIAFLTAYTSVGIFFPGDTYDGQPVEKLADVTVLEGLFENEMTILAQRCILDMDFKHILSSAIASAILYQVRLDCGVEPAWRPELTKLTAHNPLTSKSVGLVLDMFASMRDVSGSSAEYEEARDSLDSVDALLASAAANMSLSPATPILTRTRGPPSSEDLCTPVQNKENAKPLDPALKTSPTAIAINF